MNNAVQRLRSMRYTLCVYTVMVWGWGYLMLGNIEGFPFVLALLLPLLVALPLLFLTLRFSTRLSGLAGPRLFANSRVIWLYITGNAVTLGGFVLANVIAHLLHHPEYVIPGATLALSLHFLFIALAFQEKRGYLTLAVFCLTALLVPVTVPLQITLGPLITSKNGGGWMLATSLIGLIWLWLMAVSVLVRGARISREMQKTALPAGQKA